MNATMPMIRRIYPTMIKEDVPQIWQHGSLSDPERFWLRGFAFLSKKKLKNRLNCWKHNSLDIVYLVNLGCDADGSPIDKSEMRFFLPMQMDNFIVELANLSDLHGIIRITRDEIWMTRGKNASDFNVDDKVLDRISKILIGRKL